MKITDHFELEEFTDSRVANSKKIDNTPTIAAVVNMVLLTVNVLEPARVALGSPINITSGYRCKELNKAVGGVKNSQHVLGMAADLQCYNMKALFDILKEMDVDQLLFEKNKSGEKWIHVSYNANGNRHYINENYNV